MHDDGQGRHVGGEPSRRRGHSPLLPALVVVLAALGVATALALQRSASSPPRAGPGSQRTVHNGTVHSGTGHDGKRHEGTGKTARGQPAPGATARGRIDDQAVYDRILPSIVDVTSTLRHAGETASGTGFVISGAEALVLTNNHVVRGAIMVTATLVRTGRTYTARIVGVDAVHDVALLQLKGSGGLTAAPVGNSALLTPGMPVLAIGNQARQGGSPTIAPGVITGLNRTIQAAEANSGFTETLHNMLQTSAQIAPGDSGGPLANSAGQVIGMDTAAGTGAAAGAAVAGYAIPINDALSAARLIAAAPAS